MANDEIHGQEEFGSLGLCLNVLWSCVKLLIATFLAALAIETYFVLSRAFMYFAICRELCVIGNVWPMSLDCRHVKRHCKVKEETELLESIWLCDFLKQGLMFFLSRPGHFCPLSLPTKQQVRWQWVREFRIIRGGPTLGHVLEPMLFSSSDDICLVSLLFHQTNYCGGSRSLELLEKVKAGSDMPWQ